MSDEDVRRSSADRDQQTLQARHDSLRRRWQRVPPGLAGAGTIVGHRWSVRRQRGEDGIPRFKRRAPAALEHDYRLARFASLESLGAYSDLDAVEINHAGGLGLKDSGDQTGNDDGLQCKH